MVPRAGSEATALRMAGNSLAKTASTLGCAAVAPLARRGAPLLMAACCHIGSCTAAEFVLYLGRAACVLASHLSPAAAANWPGAMVTPLTPSVYACVALPSRLAQLAAACVGLSSLDMLTP